MVVRLGQALRTTTARGVKGRAAAGGGSRAVLTSANITYLGGFRLPQGPFGAPISEQVGNNTTAFSYGGIAFRSVGGQARLFAMTHGYNPGVVYEVAVPGTLHTSGSINTWTIATVVNAWGDISSTYRPSTTSKVRSSVSNSVVELQESTHYPDDWFNGMSIKLTSGTGSGQTRQITDWVASTRQATIDSPWSTNPDSNTVYILWHGTCQGSSSNTITLDSNASSTTDEYKYYQINIVDGTGSSPIQRRTITAYNGTTKVATVNSNWTTNPVSGDSKYRLSTRHLAIENASTWDMDPGGNAESKGLFWDETDQRLYYGWGHWYGSVGESASIAFAKLDDTTLRATPFGPWRLSNAAEKFRRTGALAIPASFQSYVGGKRIGVGFGGYYSNHGAGGCSGPAIGAIDPPSATRYLPTGGTAVSTAWPALTDTRLLGHPTPGNQPSPPYPSRRNNDYKNRDPFGPFNGTVTASTSTTVTFSGAAAWRESSGASGAGYLDSHIEILTSTVGAAGQIRRISANDYASQVVTVDTAWTTNPAAGDTFRIYTGIAQAGSLNTITLQADVTRTNWVDRYVAITSGTGAGQEDRKITAYNSGTKVATVTPDWSTPPASGSYYEIYDSGFGLSVWDPSGGVGYFTWMDTCNGGIWIETTNYHGIIFAWTLGHGNVHYEASNRFASGGMRDWWHIYDPSDLVAVAQGSIQQYEVNPDNYHEPTEFSGIGYVGAGSFPGITYDATNRRIYAIHPAGYLDGVNWFPAVFVYQVDD